MLICEEVQAATNTEVDSSLDTLDRVSTLTGDDSNNTFSIEFQCYTTRENIHDEK
jgi:hypothetical protein